MDSDRLVLRTHTHQFRIADVSVGKTEVVLSVKRKSKFDEITLSELMQQIFGQGVKCVVYGKGENVLFEF